MTSPSRPERRVFAKLDRVLGAMDSSIPKPTLTLSSHNTPLALLVNSSEDRKLSMSIVDARKVLNELSSNMTFPSTSHLFATIQSTSSDLDVSIDSAPDSFVPTPAHLRSPTPESSDEESGRKRGRPRRKTAPRSPGEDEATQVCSQCRRTLPLSSFPTKILDLNLYAVCKFHTWYWSAEKKLGWAPEEETDLDLVGTQVRRRLMEGEGSVDTWLVPTAEDKEDVIKSLLGSCGWTYVQRRTRKSRATIVPPPPPVFVYTISPPSNFYHVPMKLTLAQHTWVNKYIVTLKLDDSKPRIPAKEKRKTKATYREREESEPPIWSEDEEDTKVSLAQHLLAETSRNQATPAQQNALQMIQIIETTLNKHNHTLAPPPPPEVRKSSPPKRQRQDSNSAPFATGPSTSSNVNVPTNNNLLRPPPNTGRAPLNRTRSTTPPHHPQPHRVPFVTAPLPQYPISPMRPPRIQLPSNTPLTLADLLASPFLGSPPLPARRPRRRSPPVVATPGETEDNDDAATVTSDLNKEEDLEVEDEEEESEEEEEEGEFDWLTDFVKGQWETGDGYYNESRQDGGEMLDLEGMEEEGELGESEWDEEEYETDTSE